MSSKMSSSEFALLPGPVDGAVAIGEIHNLNARQQVISQVPAFSVRLQKRIQHRCDQSFLLLLQYV